MYTRRHPMLKRRGTIAIACFAIASVTLAGYQSFHSTSARAVLPSPASLQGGYPPVIAQKIAALNDALERCLLIHGARRVELGGGAWTYDDAGSEATQACKARVDASNAFASSSEMRQAEAAIQLATAPLEACLRLQGLRKSWDDGQSPTRATLVAALSACGVDPGGAATTPG